MRHRPILRVRCERCGLRLTGELHDDGKLYPSRHPELAQDSTQPFRCLSCAEKGAN
jgi:hypothetical protein